MKLNDRTKININHKLNEVIDINNLKNSTKRNTRIVVDDHIKTISWNQDIVLCKSKKGKFTEDGYIVNPGSILLFDRMIDNETYLFLTPIRRLVSYKINEFALKGKYNITFKEISEL